jgi:hypothetical protein
VKGGGVEEEVIKRHPTSRKECRQEKETAAAGDQFRAGLMGSTVSSCTM